jgi:hypothetical protein
MVPFTYPAGTFPTRPDLSYVKLRLVYEKRLVGDLLKSERRKTTCKTCGLDDYNWNPLLRAGTAL